MNVIEIANRLGRGRIPRQRLRQAVAAVAREEGPATVEISVAVVNDAEISRLHERSLGIAGPTDVLTYPLAETDHFLCGEIVVSAETAAAAAARQGWSTEDELVLYVIHGMLHLVGYDDHVPADRRLMRAAERRYLRLLGVAPARTRTAVGRVVSRKAKRERVRP